MCPVNLFTQFFWGDPHSVIGQKIKSLKKEKKTINLKGVKYWDARQKEKPAQHQREHDIPAALPKPTERQRDYKIQSREKKKKREREKNHNSLETDPWSAAHSPFKHLCALHLSSNSAFQQGEQSEIWVHKQFLGRGWERGQADIMELGHKSPEQFLDLSRLRTIQLLSSSGEKAGSWTCQSNEALAFYGNPSVPAPQLKIQGM